MANAPKVIAKTRAEPEPGGPDLDPAQLGALRDLFWNNVVREMLSGLIVAAQKHPELMDGRFGVLTRNEERIPIARVEPVFGYTVRGNSAERQTSQAIQMTVFRITTPEGEVFTLPVHEVRGFHELTPELLERLEKAEAEAAGEDAKEGAAASHPFGFAAFKALPKGPPPHAAPMHPTE